jgi:hypothetical protein
MATWRDQVMAVGASQEVAEAIITAGYDSETCFQECIKDTQALGTLLKSALVGKEGLTVENAAIHPLLVKLRKLLPAQPVTTEDKSVVVPAGDSSSSKKSLKPEKRKEFKTFYETAYPGSIWGSDRTSPSDETLLAFWELVEKAPDTAAGPFQSNAIFVPYFRISSVQEARDRDLAREEKKAAREAKEKRDGKKRKREVRVLLCWFYSFRTFHLCLFWSGL